MAYGIGTNKCKGIWWVDYQHRVPGEDEYDTTSPIYNSEDAAMNAMRLHQQTGEFPPTAILPNDFVDDPVPAEIAEQLPLWDEFMKAREPKLNLFQRLMKMIGL